MVVVSSVEPDNKKFAGRHPTETPCRWVSGYSGGQRILQLNSYGSKGRDFPDKPSQTLQFDEAAARQLFDVLKSEFGF